MAIRGDHQDEAVLCTDKATFDLKVADTSNSLLLVPHCAIPKDEGMSCILTKFVIGSRAIQDNQQKQRLLF